MAQDFDSSDAVRREVHPETGSTLSVLGYVLTAAALVISLAVSIKNLPEVIMVALICAALTAGKASWITWLFGMPMISLMVMIGQLTLFPREERLWPSLIIIFLLAVAVAAINRLLLRKNAQTKAA